MINQSIPINILSFLLFANENNNPRSMGVLHIRHQLLASLYERHSRLEGSFLSRREIVSHVSAAETDKRIVFIQLEKGTILYQWTRPAIVDARGDITGGWIGDYYASESHVGASELGASPEVTDPLDDTRRVGRVHIELVVARVDKLAAAITTAKPVNDTWSIINEIIPTQGGAEQYYAPIVAAAKQATIVMVKPEGMTPEQLIALEAIAEKNNLRLLSREDIAMRYKVSKFISAYQRTPLSVAAERVDSTLLIDQERRSLDATMRGHYHEAIELLENILANSQDEACIEIIKATLGALYGSVGRTADAQNYLNSFVSYYENSQNPYFIAKYKQLFLYAKHHLSLNLLNPEESIACLSALEQFVEDARRQNMSTSSSSSAVVSSTEMIQIAPLYLDLAIRYNQIAGHYSDSLTFLDFDEDGKQIFTKNEAAKKAEEYLALVLTEDSLPLPEKIVALTELGFSLRKQRRWEESVQALLKAKKGLEDYQKEVIDPLMLKDIEQQHLSLRLGIGLALCKFKELKKELKAFDKHTFMQKLYEDLNQLDIMTRRFLFTRWIGSNDGDLFMTGWFDGKNDANHERGTNLIRLYREVFPVEIDKICTALRNNTITSLELPYLGEAPPTGISDEKFEQLMQALAVNTSLKKLYLRKFSNCVDPVANPYRRFPKLAEALSLAQTAGQRLTYLSYSASRYHADEGASMVEFLNTNESLVVLQPSFYDIQNEEIFRAYGRAISRLPRLVTLLTGILCAPNAGKIIGEACESNPSFKYLHPFPCKQFFEGQVDEEANNRALFESKDRLDYDINLSIVRYMEELKTEIQRAYLGELRSKSRRKKPHTLEMKKNLEKIHGFTPALKLPIHQILQMSKRSFGETHPVTIAAQKCYQTGGRGH
ncbi:MAG: hypothetical protein ACHQUC_06360 [Chlamydiales bacterium]